MLKGPLAAGILLAAIAAANAAERPPAPPPADVVAKTTSTVALPPEPAAVAAKCRSGVLDFPALWSQIRRYPSFDEQLLPPESVVGGKLDDYAVCQAAASNNPEACRPREGPCRDEALRARFVFAALGGAGISADKECGSFISRSNLERDVKEAAPRICRAWAAALHGAKSEEAARSDVRAAGYRGPEMAFAFARPEDCDRRTNAFSDCRRLSTLAGALRAGTCEAAPLCAALAQGQPAACAAFLKDAARAFCAEMPAYARLHKRLGEIVVLSSGSAVTPPVVPALNPKEIALATEKKRQTDMLKAGEPERTAALQKTQEAELKEKRELQERLRGERRFQPKQPMQMVPPDVQKQMKEIEEEGLKNAPPAPPQPQPQ